MKEFEYKAEYIGNATYSLAHTFLDIEKNILNSCGNGWDIVSTYVNKKDEIVGVFKREKR